MNYIEGEKLVRRELTQYILAKVHTSDTLEPIKNPSVQKSFCDLHAQGAYSIRGRMLLQDSRMTLEDPYQGQDTEQSGASVLHIKHEKVAC